MNIKNLRTIVATAAFGLSIGLSTGSALAQASFAAPPQIPYGAPISTEAKSKVVSLMALWPLTTRCPPMRQKSNTSSRQ